MWCGIFKVGKYLYNMKSLVFKSVIQTTRKKQSEESNLWLSGHCSSPITELQATPDNSNLLGKWKKFLLAGV